MNRRSQPSVLHLGSNVDNLPKLQTADLPSHRDV
jgi:hypothetical protein